MDSQPKVRKVVKRSAAAAVPAALDEGNTIEFSATVEVKHPRKGNYWPKFGSSTQIRPGETPRQAADRLKGFVHAELDAQVLEWLAP